MGKQVRRDSLTLQNNPNAEGIRRFRTRLDSISSNLASADDLIPLRAKRTVSEPPLRPARPALRPRTASEHEVADEAVKRYRGRQWEQRSGSSLRSSVDEATPGGPPGRPRANSANSLSENALAELRAQADAVEPGDFSETDT